MELADSVYNIGKLNTTLKNAGPQLQNEIAKPLNALSNMIGNIDFTALNNPLSSRSALDGCDLPVCKSIRLLDDLIKCQGPACDTFRSVADWIRDGPPTNGVCNDPICSITKEIDTMIRNPLACDNALCLWIKNLVSEDSLTSILMQILNFILGPFKGPFTMMLLVITLVILAMFSILSYLVFFK